MKKIYSSLDDLIKNELSTEEEANTAVLITELEHVKKQGYLTKDEFLKIGMWKSPRAKRYQLKNSEAEVISTSKEVLSTDFEKRRLELLDKLRGVAIPTASAILMIIDPENYGVIDIRVWQILFLYGSVKVNLTGTNLSFENWYNYLMKLRYYSKKFNVSARNIEITIFKHHKKIQEGNLYPGNS